MILYLFKIKDEKKCEDQNLNDANQLNLYKFVDRLTSVSLPAIIAIHNREEVEEDEEHPCLTPFISAEEAIFLSLQHLSGISEDVFQNIFLKNKSPTSLVT